jgi:hypothetical protein
VHTEQIDGVEPLQSALGQPISRVRRIHYTFDGIGNPSR